MTLAELQVELPPESLAGTSEQMAWGQLAAQPVLAETPATNDVQSETRSCPHSSCVPVMSCLKKPKVFVDDEFLKTL